MPAGNASGTAGADGSVEASCLPGYVCCTPEYECHRSVLECKQGSGGAPSGAGANGIGGREIVSGGDGGEPHTDGGAKHTSSGAGGGAGTVASGGTPQDGGDDGLGGLGGAPQYVGGSAGGPSAGSGSSAAGRPAGTGGAIILEGDASVVTQHQDNQRTGANLRERVLTTENVSLGTFGKTSQRPLRGAVYAQPLYVPALAVGDGEPKNVVFVATMRNYVYAFDADDPAREPYWVRKLAAPITLPDPTIRVEYPDIWDEVGVLGTPAIDPGEKAMYLVAAHADEYGDYSHLLYKLDLKTGEDFDGVPPVPLGATGLAQRTALLLDNGLLYVTFGRYEPNTTLPGRVRSFDSELELFGQFDTDGGIWMPGQGPALDAQGTLYLTRPAFSTQSSSLVALNLGRGVLLSGRSYTPAAAKEPLGNRALGASGPLILPDTERVAVAGGRHLYLLDTSPPSSDGAELKLIQDFRINSNDNCIDPSWCNQVFGSPVFWAGPEQSRLYVWAAEDVLRAFRFDPATQNIDCGSAVPPDCDTVSESAKDETTTSGAQGFPGGMLAISANGNQAGSGIVWASTPYYPPYPQPNADAVIRAFDAEDLGNQLWRSSADVRDALGPMSKFVAPVPVGGQVFVPTLAGFTDRVTFSGIRTSWGPGLTAIGDDTLVLSWMSNERALGLRLVWSHDGFDFESNQTTLSIVSQFEPALASDGAGRLFLAYGEPGVVQPVKVAALEGPDFSEPRPLVQAGSDAADAEVLGYCHSAPALAYGDGSLYLAWSEPERAFIHVCSSSDGETFDVTQCTVIEQESWFATGLFFTNHKLYVTAVKNGRMTLLESLDHGLTFANSTTLEQESAVTPALTASTTSGVNAPDYYLFYADPRTTNTPMKLLIAEQGEIHGFAGPHELREEETSHGIAAATFRNQIYVAWTGRSIDGNTDVPNIARYNPGELVSYGLISK